jgi:RNA recognition motif-containing protein
LEEDELAPILVVEVVSSSSKVEYELEKGDVRQVFEKFGPVSHVEVNDKCNQAFVTMENLQNGQQAEKYLNFYQLPGTNAYLTVKWQFGDFESLQKARDARKQKLEKKDGSQTTCNKNYQGKPSLSSDSHLSVGGSKECTSVSKFTCKYFVELPHSGKNLPGFSVARKIIGHRGKNMKAILDKLKDSHFPGPIQDVIKLRLRGQGSGFKEGPNNCESPEPLHLCVSSKYYEKYTEGCKLVEKLLKDVYQEYNNFCRWRGKHRGGVKYNVKKVENNPACYLSNHSNQAQQ